MKKVFLVLAAVCSLYLVSWHQGAADDPVAAAAVSDTINWSPEYKLTWQDFQGPIDRSSKGVAATHSGLISSASLSPDNTVTITVRSVFLRSSSWVKPEGRTADILRHEQGHFDITEIYARRANAAFRKHTFTRKNFNKDISRIFNTYVEESNRLQQQYDLETNHSINEVRQKEWNEKIAQWLRETE